MCDGAAFTNVLLSPRKVLGQYRERVGDVHMVEVAAATTPNRFRYWDLKEAVSKLHVMGFQSAEGLREVERKGKLAGRGKRLRQRRA
jgi:hypothetical protein